MSASHENMRYGTIAQFFHWSVVLMLVFQYIWAWLIEETESITLRLELVAQHKTIGMLVLVFAVLRLVWRFIKTPPPLPATMSGWEKWAAKMGHLALYGLLFAVPISGWFFSQAAGYGDYWWGPISIPSVVEPSVEAEELFYELHEIFVTLLMVVVAVHVLAALRHHFILKDDVLKRMLPKWFSS